MPKPPIKINIKIETQILNRKMHEYRRYQKKPLWEVIEQMGTWFTQSVLKATPPKRGAMKKRSVIEVSRTRQGFIEGTSRMWGRTETRYKVPFRTNKKKGVKYFAKKAAANKFAKILFRNIGKFGWLIAARKAIGERALKKHGGYSKVTVKSQVKNKTNQIARGYGRKRLFSFAVFVNMVRGVGRYGNYAKLTALRRVKNRLGRVIKDFKKKMNRKWNQLH